MNLKPHDHHLIFDDDSNRLVVWNASHQTVFTCEARNRTVGGDSFGHLGRCPRGEFVLGPPRSKNTVPFGPFFIPVLDYGAHHEMADWDRAGIGLHGGGSGLAHPFAPEQGWQVTEGCIRVQNSDLLELVKIVQTAQALGGVGYLTVTGA